jgi:1-acyl-sn-glycerol-3-phosphate acyltransferase
MHISKPTTFYPPRLNLSLVRVFHHLAPHIARWFYQLELVVVPKDLEKLRELKDQRVLLLPNHPTFQDPLVIFLLSAQLRQAFYYLAAQELFTGALGPFFQRIGVYSIRRGLRDRASVTQTLTLLTQSSCQLVVFPEGGCSFQNDTVMPFRAGAVQLALQAMQRLVNTNQDVPDFYAVPISIKYCYTQDMTPVIQRLFRELEQALWIKPQPDLTDYERLRAIAHQVLIKVETDYGFHTFEMHQKPWNQRIAMLKEQVLANCEQQLGLTSHPQELARERTYRIEYALKLRADQLESASEAVPTDLIQGDLSFELMEKSVKRLLNFDAIYDGYVAEDPTSERFLDTLIRLEREVFEIDQPPPKGHRQAQVKISDPVNLKSMFAEYQRDRATLNIIVEQLQQAVQAGLTD